VLNELLPHPRSAVQPVGLLHGDVHRQTTLPLDKLDYRHPGTLDHLQMTASFRKATLLQHRSQEVQVVAGLALLQGSSTGPENGQVKVAAANGEPSRRRADQVGFAAAAERCTDDTFDAL